MGKSGSWKGVALATAMMAALVLGSQPMAWAASSDQYLEGSAKKFGRGVVNTATGWAEVIKQPIVGAKEKGFEGGVAGFFVGIGMTVARTAVGVYDTATFLVPVPENFQPVMEPELVLEK